MRDSSLTECYLHNDDHLAKRLCGYELQSNRVHGERDHFRCACFASYYGKGGGFDHRADD